jgi:hypothetical protein
MSHLIASLLGLLSLGMLLTTTGCGPQAPSSALASQARELALFLKPSSVDIQEHKASQRARLTFEKGQLDFAVLVDGDVSDRSWCYTVYRLDGDGPWGIVPGTVRPCAMGDLEEQKARAKDVVDTWLRLELKAPKVESDVAFLAGPNGLGRTGEMVARAAGSGISLKDCVEDAIDVQTDLMRDMLRLRCDGLMSEDVNPLELLTEQQYLDLLGPPKLTAGPDGSGGEEVNASEGFSKRLNELPSEKRAAWLMIADPQLASSCWRNALLADDATAHDEVTEAAMALCTEGARRAGAR